MVFYSRPIWHLLATGILFIGPGPALNGEADLPPVLTDEQQDLVEFALRRFEAQGLELPDVEFVFRDSLEPCSGHKGRYYGDSEVVEMCSLDKTTMVHELAHAWAKHKLTTADMEGFVELRGLDSWNDHDDAWERRGTEHVAETIAWALMDDPHHVKWVETLPDGSERAEHRILTIEVDVETLVDNFELLTGMSPTLRDPVEWAIDDEPPAFSPEALRGK